MKKCAPKAKAATAAKASKPAAVKSAKPAAKASKPVKKTAPKPAPKKPVAKPAPKKPAPKKPAAKPAPKKPAPKKPAAKPAPKKPAPKKPAAKPAPKKPAPKKPAAKPAPKKPAPKKPAAKPAPKKPAPKKPATKPAPKKPAKPAPKPVKSKKVAKVAAEKIASDETGAKPASAKASMAPERGPGKEAKAMERMSSGRRGDVGRKSAVTKKVVPEVVKETIEVAVVAAPVPKRPKLKAEDLRRLRQALEQERQRLIEDIRALDDQALTDGLAETMSQQPGFSLQLADSASDNQQVDTALGIRSIEASQLAQIDDALRAIEEGDYGVCHRCAEAISLDRLLVKPMAKYCVPCLRLLESGKA